MQHDRIFKGATRPAMMLGVPIVPFILVFGIFAILAAWSLVFFGFTVCAGILIALVFILLILRFVTAHDDQRLNQYFMFLRSWPHRRRNREYWGAHAMTPMNYKKRKSL